MAVSSSLDSRAFARSLPRPDPAGAPLPDARQEPWFWLALAARLMAVSSSLDSRASPARFLVQTSPALRYPTLASDTCSCRRLAGVFQRQIRLDRASQARAHLCGRCAEGGVRVRVKVGVPSVSRLMADLSGSDRVARVR